jgi:hypothetical protein
MPFSSQTDPKNKTAGLAPAHDDMTFAKADIA